MAGLPWYRMWKDFSRHGKTMQLAAALNDRNAGMYIVRLLEHCAEYALDGCIHADAVEGAADWRGKRGRFLAVAVEVGFLEAAGEKYRVHDWEERNGSHIRKTLGDAKKPRGNKPASRPGPEGDGGGTAAGPPREPEAVPPGEIEIETEKKTEKQQQPCASERAAAPLPVSAGRAAECGHPPSAPAPSRPEAGQDDLPPRRPLELVDNAPVPEGAAPAVPAWPRLRQFRERFAAALGRRVGLPVGAAAAHDELEAQLERVGIEAALVCCGDVSRRQRGAVHALSYFLPALRELPTALAEGPTLGERVAAAVGPEWRQVLEGLLETALGHPERESVLTRWLLPLTGTLRGGVLALLAPDEHHAAFVQDQYRERLEELAASTLGRVVRVDVTAPPRAAGGEA